LFSSPYIYPALEKPMSLKDAINNDIKDAMRAKDAGVLTTLRMLTAAIKQREVDERITLTDADVLTLVNKLIKQRRESIAMYEKGGRADLAANEASEITLLEKYLPTQLTEAEINQAITSAISAAGVQKGAATGADMGKVMGILKPPLAGKADMAKVSALLKAALA
jgi:uncharacterized protein YqeY